MMEKPGCFLFFPIALLIFSVLMGSPQKKLDGAKIFKEKNCATCHSLSQEKRIGPGLGGIFGKKVTVITKGKEKIVTVDENYLIRSMVSPKKEVVKGFFTPCIVNLREKKIKALVQFIKTLKAKPSSQKKAKPKKIATKKSKKLDGAKLFKTKTCIVCHSMTTKKLVGPGLGGIFGKKVTVITKGKERSVVVDEKYLKESILNPNKDVVKGFPPIMILTSSLKKIEVEALVQFIKTLSKTSKKRKKTK